MEASSGPADLSGAPFTAPTIALDGTIFINNFSSLIALNPREPSYGRFYFTVAGKAGRVSVHDGTSIWTYPTNVLVAFNPATTGPASEVSCGRIAAGQCVSCNPVDWCRWNDLPDRGTNLLRSHEWRFALECQSSGGERQFDHAGRSGHRS
jgi:hypothetical protein